MPSYDRPLSQPSARDLFHELPVEALLLILKSCPDFSTLWSLINVSKHTYAVFDLYALDVFDVIFAAPRPAVTQAFMQAVLDIRTGRFNLRVHRHILQCAIYPSLFFGFFGSHDDDSDTSSSEEEDDVDDNDGDGGAESDSVDSDDVSEVIADIGRRMTTTASRTFSEHDFTPTLDRPSSEDADKDKKSPALVRKFVALAHSVHVMAHTALDSCLERFAELQPFPWASPRRPDGGGTQPPSWTEEQRALLAFWRVQLFNEFKVAGAKGRLSNSVRHNNMLKNNLLRKFFRTPVAQCQAEFATRHLPRRDIQYGTTSNSPQNMLRLSLFTNAHSVWPIRLSDLDRDSEFGGPCAITAAPANLRQPQRDDAQEFRTLNDVHPQLRPARKSQATSSRNRNTHHSGDTYWWQVSNVIALANRTGVEWEDLSAATMGLEIHASSKNNRHAGLLQRNGFFKFHCFGMGLWDQKRLIELGLWTDEKPLLDASRYYHRWQYLLQDERCTESTQDWYFGGEDKTPISYVAVESGEQGSVRF